MLPIPAWDTEAAVTTPAATVTVDGAVLDVDRVTVSRELASSLPGTVISGTGITGATGDVTWSQTEDVSERSATPWARAGGVPPASGARVLVDLGDERGQCRVMTGRADTASGRLSDGVALSELVDDIDRLNRPFTQQPLMNSMPPLTPGGTARYVGMSGIWVADRVLRACGFHATPSVGTGAVVSATMMGSAWPEVGTVASCIAPIGGAFPLFPASPWGLCAQDIDVTYTPATAKVLDSPMEVLLQWPVAGESAGAYVLVMFGTASLRVVLTASQVVVQEPSGVTVLSVARGTSLRTIVRFTPSGANLGIEARVSDGTTASTTITPTATLLSAPMSSVRVFASDTDRVGPVRVSFPASPFVGLTHAPTAVFDIGSTTMHALSVLPAITRQSALELLKGHAAAVAAGLWIDEEGRVRWVARDRLGVGASVRTLTSRDDLLDAAWSDQWRDVYSAVEVGWVEITATRSSRDNVTLWEGGGSVETGEIVAEVIHPASGEDWIMVDTSITKAGPSGTIEEFNYGHGSWTGAALTDETTSDETWAATTLVDTSLRQIDWRTYAIETTVGTVPAGQRAELQAPSNFASGVWSARWGQPLPVLRGRGKFQATQTASTSATTGPADAAVYSHDAGWWVQSEAQAITLANWIAQTATISTPQLGRVEVNFDPRLQLGDVVKIEDTDQSGLRITGTIVALSHGLASGDATTTLALRVTLVERLTPTLAEYDLVWAGEPLSARDTYWSGQTLADFDADPLARS